ncbi:neutral zinc metallopeptidase [Nonomuraea sp. NPDC003727]
MSPLLRLALVAILAVPSTVAGANAAGASATKTDDLQQDIRTAVHAVNLFWSEHWSDYFPGRYTPPRVVGSYNGRSAYRPRCSGYLVLPYNASYCTTQDFIAWDINLMRMSYSYGDGLVYQVISHEWSHAIQNRMPYRYLAAQIELQADCLGGAALAGASRDGTLVWERGDSQEIAATLRAMSGDTPWTNPRDHGSASERIDAFNTGVRYGVRACLA